MAWTLQAQTKTDLLTAASDIQTALENWVENGDAPEGMVATKYTDDAAATRTIKLTRPLCAWPAVPRYKGAGDANDARSFACVGGPTGDKGDDEDDD